MPSQTGTGWIGALAGRSTFALALVAALTAATASVAGAEEGSPQTSCGVFLLRVGHEGVTVERHELAPGEVGVWPSDAETGVLDVILPPGRGGSGRVAQLDGKHVHVVRCADGRVHHQVLGADGKTTDYPARELADLERYDIRLSVVGGDGTRRAFLIPGYETVEPDAGPVQNLFAGTPLPLGTHDYILTTDTDLRITGELVAGTAPLELNGHPFARVRGPGGREGWFVVDIGAAETLVARDFLPEGTAVEKSAMVEYSSAGRRLLDYTPGGATGKVQGVVGHATLDFLEVGTIRFPGVTTAVMERLPDLFDRPVMGILGMDLLRRASRLTLTFPADARGPGSLRLDAAGGSPPDADRASEVAFSTVSSHVLVPAEANGVPVHLILDSGAPGPLLDESTARAAGVTVSRDARDVRGLDETGAASASGTIHELVLGGSRFADVDCKVARLAAFRTLQSDGQHVGLLGNAFFGRFRRVEIDFERRRVRFVADPVRGSLEIEAKQRTPA